MSDQVKELLEVPRDFVKEGTQFINRCTKRTWISLLIPRYDVNERL